MVVLILALSLVFMVFMVFTVWALLRIIKLLSKLLSPTKVSEPPEEWAQSPLFYCRKDNVFIEFVPHNKENTGLFVPCPICKEGLVPAANLEVLNTDNLIDVTDRNSTGYRKFKQYERSES